jgi:hypothetical protein
VEEGAGRNCTAEDAEDSERGEEIEETMEVTISKIRGDAILVRQLLLQPFARERTTHSDYFRV